MAMPAMKYVTYDEYLNLEAETDWRHEWLDGACWAMSGGTFQHSKVKTNLVRVMGNLLDRGPCQPYDADLKVRIGERGLATYPDLSVVCGRAQIHPGDRNALTNPTLLVEVLSPSTASWDQGGKFAQYRSIPTLRYVLWIEPLDRWVELAAREGGDVWRLSRHTPAETLHLDAIGVDLPLENLFFDVPPVEPGDDEPVAAGPTLG